MLDGQEVVTSPFHNEPMGNARSVMLRSVLRGGYLTEQARRETVEQLYHWERSQIGMADGREYWYEAEVTW